jgi:hypothetical protein
MIPRRCRKDRGITVLDQKRRSSQSEPETVSAETETQPRQRANGGLSHHIRISLHPRSICIGETGFLGPETDRPKSPSGQKPSPRRPKRSRNSPPMAGSLAVSGEICRFERLRGGLGRSISGEPRQRRTARYGRFGPIDAQKEFSTMPAPPSARHKKRSATARRARGDARGRREGRLMRSRHKPKPLLLPQGSWPEVQWRVLQQRLSPRHSGDSKCSNHLCPDCDHTQK